MKLPQRLYLVLSTFYSIPQDWLSHTYVRQIFRIPNKSRPSSLVECNWVSKSQRWVLNTHGTMNGSTLSLIILSYIFSCPPYCFQQSCVSRGEQSPHEWIHPVINEEDGQTTKATLWVKLVKKSQSQRSQNIVVQNGTYVVE